jgi:hypothetical protein
VLEQLSILLIGRKGRSRLELHRSCPLLRKG